MKNYLAHLGSDIPAGLVVFFVAVPLCLGIALASGAPLFSGIISGMVGGIVVGLLSGSQLGVSGPAAGLAVIVLTAIQDLGSFQVFLMAVVIAGVIQITLGILRAGVIGYYFPESVIKGMLAAIGIIIFIKQIPYAFGYDQDLEDNFNFSQADSYNNLADLMQMGEYISPGATIIACVSLTILILWEQKFMKNIKVFQVVQGPIIAVAAGIVLNLVFSTTGLAVSQEHMVNLPVPDGVFGFLHQFTLPDFKAIANNEVWILALTIALVASLETLLCVEAADKLDPEKRVTPTNRELVAQGVGNVVSGLIGGLPITQVIVRSSANIQSGGRTKVSAIFHGILILISALFIPQILNLTPLASLAAILLVVGYKLAKPSLFRSMYAEGWSQFVPFIVTVIAIVFSDLLTGILVGLVVGLAFVIRSNYHKVLTRVERNGQILIKFNKDVTFIHKVEISKALNQIPDGSKLIIDCANASFIDHEIAETIEGFVSAAGSKNIQVKLMNFHERKAIEQN